MSVKVDMSSLESNRELVNTQAIGVKNHQCAYVRELIKYFSVLESFNAHYRHLAYIPMHKSSPKTLY